MYKKIVKQISVLSLVLISIFFLIGTVSASVSYSFASVGENVSEESSSKMSGTINLKAVHYSQYYNGQLAYTLSKKSLFGYSAVSRQQISTYNKTVDVAYWTDCSNAYYKGTLLLNVSDSSFSTIYGSFSINN